jgi:hypothetical protein
MVVPALPYDPVIPAQPCLRGQRLRVFYPNVAHEGIVYSVDLGATPNGYCWYVMVAHNSKTGGGVCLVTLEALAQGCMVRIVDSPQSKEHENFIIGQVGRARMAGIRYFLLYQNCEHFASWCYTGKAESQTLESVAKFVGGMAAISIVVAAVHSPSSGRR